MKAWHLILALVMMPIVAISVLGFTHGFEVRELKAIGNVKPFSLKASDGQTFSLGDLHNKVWIASFVFTHCGEQCPRIAKQVEELQKKLYSKENIRFVTFTVDPKHDTVDVLGKFAEQYHAKPNRWVFLTGDEDELKDVVTNSFKLSSEPAEGTVIHSSHLALVDGRGIIRGYYDAFDDSKMKLLVKDSKSLLRGLY